MAYPADEPGLLAPQWVADYALGPAQIGYTAQIWLLGVFTTAFGAYVVSGEMGRHRALGRVALWLVFGLNWAFTGLCVYESYVTTVSQNRTVFALASGNTAWQFLPILSGLTGVVTQAFLTSHAVVLVPSKRLRYIFCGCMAILIAAQITGFVAACIKGVYYVNGRDPNDDLSYNESLALWLWTSAAADILISLVCSLSIRERLHGYTKETDTVIVKLVVICFRTAAYTSLMSLVGAIVATVFQSDFDLRSFTGFVRRVVDRRPAMSEATETQPVVRVEQKGRRFGAGISWRLHRIEDSNGGSTASRGGSAGQALAIRVDCERVISVDEPRGDLDDARSDSCGASASSADRSHGPQLKLPTLPRPAVLDMV